jgi:hypothetical protein
MGRKARIVTPGLNLSAEMSRFDLFLIEGVMLWPGEAGEERQRRCQAFDRAVVEIFRPAFGALTETLKADLFALADEAHPLEAIRPWARKPFLHGLIAGTVLNNLLGLIACDQDNASLGKAIEMVLLAFPPGSQLSSATFNKTIWPKYRCVAHLWAAYSSRAMFHDRGDFPCTVGDLPAFLADAEGYRVMGESRKTKQSPKNTILLAGETIRFCLPEGVAVEPADLRFGMEPGRKL